MGRWKYGVNQKLQGVDYTYTIHGWLKGINHTISGHDPGDDGPGSNGYGSDVFSMVLGYYDGDFNRSGSPFNSNSGNSLHLGGINGLYNGNISSWTSRIRGVGAPGLCYEHAVGYQYRYDQLNRITRSNFFANTGGGWYRDAGKYDENFSYDKNGNILTLNREGECDGMKGTYLDSLTYYYFNGTNLLYNVTEQAYNPSQSSLVLHIIYGD